jgi:hypothetical protein
VCSQLYHGIYGLESIQRYKVLGKAASAAFFFYRFYKSFKRDLQTAFSPSIMDFAKNDKRSYKNAKRA